MLRALPLKDWPEEDRRIWRDALRPAQRLSAGGRAAHLRPSSKAILERNYGYFLRVVSDRGALNRSAAAATHVTPEGVEAFVERAELSRNSVSVASGVEKVRLMAQTLAPERDFGWLKNIEAQLRRSARPREKFSRMVGSEELVEAGLVLMQEARDAKSGSAGQARTFRNGLIIALLAVCPIRVGSFASLTLGRSFLRIGDGWWIRLAANETKSGRPDERPVPGFLTSSVDEYLRTYRPRFLCAGRVGQARGDDAALLRSRSGNGDRTAVDGAAGRGDVACDDEEDHHPNDPPDARRFGQPASLPRVRGDDRGAPRQQPSPSGERSAPARRSARNRSALQSGEFIAGSHPLRRNPR